MRRYVHDMITVSEQEMIDTLRFVLQRMKLIIEPSAAVALAPLLSGRFKGAGRAGVIISGGNTDLVRLRMPQGD
jgi:threonine dehydratase